MTLANHSYIQVQAVQFGNSRGQAWTDEFFISCPGEFNTSKFVNIGTICNAPSSSGIPTHYPPHCSSLPLCVSLSKCLFPECFILPPINPVNSGVHVCSHIHTNILVQVHTASSRKSCQGDRAHHPSHTYHSQPEFLAWGRLSHH
jgi:hypothetical protein